MKNRLIIIILCAIGVLLAGVLVWRLARNPVEANAVPTAQAGSSVNTLMPAAEDTGGGMPDDDAPEETAPPETPGEFHIAPSSIGEITVTPLIASAEEEAKKLKETLISAKQIEIRDKKLGAKQQTINDAITEAKKRLAAMKDSDFAGFIWKYLSEVNLTGEETLRIPKKYAEGFDMAGLNAKLKAAGKPALTLDGSVHVDNGFKLVKNDAENDFSFDALIDYYRVDLERAVVERVFQ